MNDGGFGYPARVPNPTCVAPAKPANAFGVQIVRAFPNLTLNIPLLLLQAPGDSSRVVVIERAGVVRAFPNSQSATNAQISTVVDISGRVNASGEGGLLGIAFHPQWATRKELFLSYTRSGSPLVSVISRFRSNDNGVTFDPNSEERLLQIDQPFDNHNGGMIGFGPDGFLYIGFGDGGSGGDPNNAGQSNNTNLGKFLRINVDVPYRPDAGSYAIPPSNPYATSGTPCNLTTQARTAPAGTLCAEIYATGMRNPWRWSFDIGTGDLWAGDVGQGAYEEIDLVTNGGNYGWNCYEGFHTYTNPTRCTGVAWPVFEYPRTSPDGGAAGNSVTGGFVYRSTAVPALAGRYIFGDWGNGNVWALLENSTLGNFYPRQLGTINGLAGFGQTLDGEVYALSYYGGTIWRFQATNPDAGVNDYPARLSQTGCFTSSLPTQPVPGLIPFDINSPLWSDAAQKDRYFAIPDGTTIGLAADGDFQFPNGAVTVKTFSLGGQKIETRFLVRHSDGSWAGYTYEWRSDQTDADLLPSNKTKTVGPQTWLYPSRSQCLQCHTPIAGHSLGPEVAQLNRSFLYPTGRTANQVETLAALGYFSAPLPGIASTLPRLTNPADNAAPLEARARSYLHANCSSCHRNGVGQGPMDFRYSLALSAANLCGVAATRGNAGVTGAQIMTPGVPATSLISIRPKALNAFRMPPLGTSIVDTQGTAIVDGWISSVTSCP